jgi:hypothetical protein
MRLETEEEPVARRRRRIEPHRLEERAPKPLHLLRPSVFARPRAKALPLFRVREMAMYLDRDVGMKRVFEESPRKGDDRGHLGQIREMQDVSGVDAVIGRRGAEAGRRSRSGGHARHP